MIVTHVNNGNLCPAQGRCICVTEGGKLVDLSLKASSAAVCANSVQGWFRVLLYFESSFTLISKYILPITACI